jgi:hypothetical protein
MFTRLALSAFALLAACADSPSPAGGDAVFTGRTQQQLARTVGAAAGVDVLVAEIAAQSYANTTSLCPQVESVGASLHVSGGCTADDGTTISGDAYLTNVPDVTGGNDPSQPAKAQFQHFVLVDSTGASQTFDGSLSWTATSAQVALATVPDGLGARVDASLACTASACTYASASIAVDGIGSATASGSWSLDYSSVALDVRGKDDLTISAAGRCLSYAIDGKTAGQACH